jgi:hypothetical protein
LAEDVLFGFCQHRYRARAELEQLLSSVRIVQYVQRDEANAFFRKKLFRPETAASTGLGEKDEIFAVCFHFKSRNGQLNWPQPINLRNGFQANLLSDVRQSIPSKAKRSTSAQSKSSLWFSHPASIFGRGFQ